ncbi:MAG: DNA-directed polymerase subunit alpha [Candidatus Doudnabacteria bacterium]|nr:DNA-directed polymerase subunit alpha [Candidatus Doudnabacteria bacterium]
MEAVPLPNQVSLVSQEGDMYNFVMEPLYPGYGVTIGNTLRRVLLSSMPGAAVVAVKMKWVDHEFSTIPNIKEDVIEIILNLKNLRLKVHTEEPVRLSLKVKGEKVVTSADIKETDLVEIVNKDLHIATLDNKNAELDMELIVQQGRGYVPVEQRENEKLEIGMIAVDAIYTPIKNVNYDVENVRVGQMTNFDRLKLSMETDGTITGQEALNIAAHILVDHFGMFINDASIAANAVSSPKAEISAPEAFVAEPEAESTVASVGTPVKSLNLSVRAQNALEKNAVNSVEELEAMSAEDIKNLDGLGEKSVNEILEVLGKTPQE